MSCVMYIHTPWAQTVVWGRRWLEGVHGQQCRDVRKIEKRARCLEIRPRYRQRSAARGLPFFRHHLLPPPHYKHPWSLDQSDRARQLQKPQVCAQRGGVSQAHQVEPEEPLSFRSQ